MKPEDLEKKIDQGFASIREAQEKEFESIRQRVSEEVAEKLQPTEKWLSNVEAQINTARTHGQGRDGLVAAIPKDYRKHIDIAERHGFKDPVDTAAKSLWWHYQYMIALSRHQRTPKTAGEYMKMSDDLERGWGFDPVQKDILNEGAGGGGSNIIATPVEAELWRLIRDNTVVRPFATKIIMAGPSMVIPTENANVTAYLVAEGIAITDSIASTAFAPQTLVAKKFAGLATVSNELLQDNIIGLQQYLFNSIAEGIGILEDRGALDGTNFTGIRVATGVNSLTLLANAGASATGTQNGVAPNFTELLACVFGAVQAASRDTGRFFMYPGAFKNIVGMVDTTGQPVFQFGQAAGQFASFIGGYPVSVVSSLSTSQATYTSSSNIYFGPPSKILYGDISGMSFDIDPYSLLDKVQTRVRVLKRTGILVPVGGYFTFAKGARWL